MLSYLACAWAQSFFEKPCYCLQPGRETFDTPEDVTAKPRHYSHLVFVLDEAVSDLVSAAAAGAAPPHLPAALSSLLPFPQDVVSEMQTLRYGIRRLAVNTVRVLMALMSRGEVWRERVIPPLERQRQMSAPPAALVSTLKTQAYTLCSRGTLLECARMKLEHPLFLPLCLFIEIH